MGGGVCGGGTMSQSKRPPNKSCSAYNYCNSETCVLWSPRLPLNNTARLMDPIA